MSRPLEPQSLNALDARIFLLYRQEKSRPHSLRSGFFLLVQSDNDP